MEVFGHREGVVLDVLVTLESEADELVVLAENLSRRAREVEAHLADFSAEVVDAERHHIGEILLVFPDHPSQTGVDEAELVA